MLLVRFSIDFDALRKQAAEFRLTTKTTESIFLHWTMDLFDAPFFWGRVTRQDAEEILSQCGVKNGLYLVRERFEEAGVYAITLCYLKR